MCIRDRIRALRKYLRGGEARREKAETRRTLGEVLKAHRMRCQMTQEFVAEALGVSRQAVSKWETGTADPSTSNLLALATVSYTHLDVYKRQVLDNNIDYDARTAAEELAKATRSEVVQVIGTKFVLYRESHSKPREKRIQLVKPAKKRPQ